MTVSLRVTPQISNKLDRFLTFFDKIILNMFSSYQISQRVFELTRNGSSIDGLQPEAMVLSGLHAPKGNVVNKDGHAAAAICLDKTDLGNHLLLGKDCQSKSIPFELYKRRTTAFVRRETFLDIVCDALAEYKYVGPNQRADFVLACKYALEENLFP